MKMQINQTEVMALFFRSYFLFTKIEFGKGKTEENQAQINAYKTLMRILAYYSLFPKIDSNELLSHLEKFNVPSDNFYQRIFGEVICETLTFIHEQVLFIKEKEYSFLERYT